MIKICIINIYLLTLHKIKTKSDMKPYGALLKWHRMNEGKIGQCSTQSWENFMRTDKKKARQQARKQIINELNEVL